MMRSELGSLAVSTVDLARIQFATTTIYHFLFVPLTLGLGPIVAVLLGGALVAACFPRREREEALLASYQVEDAKPVAPSPVLAPSGAAQ